MRRALGLVAALLTFGTGLCSAAGHLGALDWRLDLASHFRLQYAAVFAVALALAAALRRPRLAAAAGLLLALELTQVAPFWLAPAEAGPPALRLVHFNALTSNPRKADTTAWLAATGADVAFVQEVDAAWADALARTPGYRPLAQIPRADNFGISALVRDGAAHLVVRTWSEELARGIPALAVELSLASRPVAVLAVHTLPPVSAEYAARRDAALAAAATWVQAQRAAGRTPVVIGDLNASPFSAPLRRLVAGTGLVDSQRGRGLQGSWGGPLRIAIDHCLHDAALITVGRSLGPELGSDHRAVVVDLAWSSGH